MRPVLFCLLLLAACDSSDQKPGDTTRRPGNPPVINVDDEDARMNKAIADARASVADFLTALAKPGPKQAGFAVKAKVTDGDRSEHVWVVGVGHDGTKLTGKIGNAPLGLKNVKSGDALSVSPKEVSDWMYLDDGKLVGGYSIRLLRSRMTPAEREEFDKRASFKFD